jgi:hypothetical protein
MTTTTMDALASAAVHAPPPAPAGAVERLLRNRGALVADIVAGRSLGAIARAMLLTIVLGGALFGAALGVYRGGIQIAYAALKLPMVLVFTAALAAPALTAFNLALDRPADLRRDLAFALCALALGALVLAAEAPLIFVARALDAEYHQTTLLVVGCCALAGLVSLGFLVRALRVPSPRFALTAAGLLCVVTMVVGAQAAWTLRPYLVRPRTPDVPFLRDVDGNLLDAVEQTFESARGRYHRDEAPLPEPTKYEVAPAAVDQASDVDDLDEVAP